MNRLGPPEIRSILAITDALGIHRESVRVPLTGRSEGGVRVTESSQLEIVAPAEGDVAAWIETLPRSLATLDLSRVRRAE